MVLAVINHTRQHRTFLWAKDPNDAEKKAWDKLNPNDQDWGYSAKWVVKECKVNW